MKGLLKYLKDYKVESVLGPLFKMLEASFELFVPLVVARMVDVGIRGRDSGYILKMGGVLVLLALIGLACSLTAQYFAAKAATGAATSLRNDLFSHIGRLSYTEIDTVGTSTLITRMTSDINQVQSGINMTLRLLLRSPFVVFGAMVMAFTVDVRSAFVFVVTIPVLCVVVFGIMAVSMPLYKSVQRQLDKVLLTTRENLLGVRVIRAFNRQDAECRRFEKANEDYALTAIASGHITSLLMPAISVIFGVTTAAVLGIGARYVESGAMEIGSLVANSQYISMVLTAVMMLSLVIMMFPSTYACARRIAEVLDTKPSIKDGNFPLKNRPLRSTVEFSHVTFSYPGADEPVLKDVSFTARPGEVTAIIGGTGRGKSTILKLISRLYDPLSGQVLIDGINAGEYRIEDLHSLIGYVPQKNVLFSGDIAENLNFGKENGREEDWNIAAKIACADEFITKKEQGFHEPVAQGGVNLSGGQRQRLAIARALMKKPEIYVFDDSFSALDMKTDHRLRQNLKEYTGNAAVILVAQRISSILDADQILVVDDGKIIGNGTHQELLSTCPLYREIAELQLGGSLI